MTAEQSSDLVIKKTSVTARLGIDFPKVGMESRYKLNSCFN
jgi:hypothetical protein